MSSTEVFILVIILNITKEKKKSINMQSENIID